MKLIINISDESYDKALNGIINCKECFDAIVYGTPIPDNATNGQVIQTLFKPNRVERTDDDVIVENYDFSKKWWNSPYQKGG